MFIELVALTASSRGGTLWVEDVQVGQRGPGLLTTSCSIKGTTQNWTQHFTTQNLTQSPPLHLCSCPHHHRLCRHPHHHWTVHIWLFAHPTREWLDDSDIPQRIQAIPQTSSSWVKSGREKNNFGNQTIQFRAVQVQCFSTLCRLYLIKIVFRIFWGDILLWLNLLFWWNGWHSAYIMLYVLRYFGFNNSILLQQKKFRIQKTWGTDDKLY